MSLEPGTRLGPYEIVESIGAGGMGEVFRARDSRLDRDVAVKVLPKAFAENPSRLERFEREAKAVAALSHPNILAIHDFGKHEGVVYAVTELLEGSTMRELLANDGPPSSRKAVEYARQVADGLAAAHDRGVVHRDIKPDNLFVTRDGRVKILDFGLAKHEEVAPIGDSAETSAPTATRHTGPGVVLGTVGYMSPEQVRGQDADHRSDLFSLGAVLYELLTGRRAFGGEAAVETMSAILKEDPPSLSSGSGDLPPGVETIVRHCLEKNPEERFQSARDLAFSLGALSGTSTSGVGALAPQDAVPRPRSRAWIWASLLTLAGVVLGAAAAIWLAPPPASTFRATTLTFRRGATWGGRFAPDEQTVIYGGAWDGKPLHTFSTTIGAAGSRELPYGPSDVLAVSSTGELALSLGRRFTAGWETVGTLARAPLGGGAPREILEQVMDADWSPDGSELAVVREVEGKVRLEYPVGAVIHEAAGWISSPRVSPDGESVAFVDHPVRGDNIGFISVVGSDGQTRQLHRGGNQRVAWSPDGDEIYSIRGGVLRATALNGKVRRVYAAPANLYLLDIASDGRLLVGANDIRREVVGKAPDEQEERNLSWLDWTTLRDLSPDGRQLLFDEGNQAARDGYTMYIRGTDGSAPIVIGRGIAITLSPDATQMLSLASPFTQPELAILPTGVGEPRALPLTGSTPRSIGKWLPEGKGILVGGAEPDGETRVYHVTPDGGEERLVTPAGIRFTFETIVTSPDGSEICVATVDDRVMILPLAGGDPRPVPGVQPGELPIQWSDDGRHLYVYGRSQLPAQIFRVDLASGERSAWAELTPADPAGVFNIDQVQISRNGEAYAYSYRRMISRVMVLEGL